MFLHENFLDAIQEKFGAGGQRKWYETVERMFRVYFGELSFKFFEEGNLYKNLSSKLAQISSPLNP